MNPPPIAWPFKIVYVCAGCWIIFNSTCSNLEINFLKFCLSIFEIWYKSRPAEKIFPSPVIISAFSLSIFSNEVSIEFKKFRQKAFAGGLANVIVVYFLLKLIDPRN